MDFLKPGYISPKTELKNFVSSLLLGTKPEIIEAVPDYNLDV